MIKSSIQGAAGGWRVLLFDPDSGEQEELSIGEGHELVSRAAWVGPSAIVLAISESTVSGTPLPSRVVRYELATGRFQTLFWAADLFPFRGSLNGTTRLGMIDDNSIVFDRFVQTQTLYEIDTDGGGARKLVGGISNDRQPAYHPDGSRVLFTSNRSGNVDLFSYEFATGKLLQLTDHPGSDWDGAYTPDGQGIIWGSDRGGTLEIWTADADGSNPRMITQDGVAAENPTMTPDGEWIVYSSGNLESLGIFRIRYDGTDAEHLVTGNWTNPEVSPDGRYALYVTSDNARLRNRVQVVTLETGETTPFLVEVPFNLRNHNVTYGRGRWTPDGSAIIYVGLDEQGRTGLWRQDFSPERNMPETRRPLVGFRGEMAHESFGVSPDGRRIVVSSIEQIQTINLADHLPNLR